MLFLSTFDLTSFFLLQHEVRINIVVIICYFLCKIMTFPIRKVSTMTSENVWPLTIWQYRLSHQIYPFLVYQKNKNNGLRSTRMVEISLTNGSKRAASDIINCWDPLNSYSIDTRSWYKSFRIFTMKSKEIFVKFISHCSFSSFCFSKVLLSCN